MQVALAEHSGLQLGAFQCLGHGKLLTFLMHMNINVIGCERGEACGKHVGSMWAACESFQPACVIHEDSWSALTKI